MSYEKATDEFPILSNHDSLFSDREFTNLRIGGSIATRQVESVSCVMTSFLETPHDPARKLSINQKVHEAAKSMRFTWLSFVAKASAARISSRSKSS